LAGADLERGGHTVQGILEQEPPRRQGLVQHSQQVVEEVDVDEVCVLGQAYAWYGAIMTSLRRHIVTMKRA
jgi:hypothetical protein